MGPGLGPDGDIYVHMEAGSQDVIRRYDAATGTFQQTFTFTAPEAGTHIEFSPTGDLLVGDPVPNPNSNEYSIWVVNGTTGLFEVL